MTFVSPKLVFVAEDGCEMTFGCSGPRHLCFEETVGRGSYVLS